MTRLYRSAAQRADKLEEPQRLASWYTPGFSDGIGDRLLMFDNGTASSLELLRFRAEFSAAPGFEEALRARVEALANFTHPAIARVRAVDSLGDDDGLALISNHTVGRRLSEILQDARGPQFATELVSQLVPVLAALQEQGGNIAHGLITPDRVVVTPEGRLVLVEHVLGSAFDSLRLPASRLQSELGLAVPPGARIASLDQRADVVQLGYLALSLLLGQRVRSVGSAGEVFGLLDRQAIENGGAAPTYLQHWLLRALQVDSHAFTSAGEAADALSDWPDLELDSDPSIRQLRAPGDTSARTPVRSRPAPSAPRIEPPQPPAVPSEPVPAPRPVIAIAREPVPVPIAAAAPALESAPAIERTLGPAPIRVSMLLDSRAARLAIAGLALVAIVEALVIAGLLNTRPAGTTPAAVTETAAAPTMTAAPPATPPAAVNTPEPATPAPAPAAASAAVGQLNVASDPAGAGVTVGGRSMGTTPLSTSLPPGEHVVVITSGSSTTRRTVNVTAGGTATLMASMPPAAPAGTTGGWVSIDTALDLQVYEGGTLIGTSRADRIMLPAGRHNLRLSSAALAYETVLAVDVRPGETVRPRVVTPNGSLSLNALPWANVSLDGQSIGTTPLANVSVPIGTHEVLWQHPQLGERRQTIVVTARSPVRLVIDLRQ